MIHPEKRRAALAEIANMKVWCKQCYFYSLLTRGVNKHYTLTHHCMKKSADLTDIITECQYFSKREVVDDIPHNPCAKSTGLYDCRGNELFEGDYIMIPYSMLDRQRVAKIVWDRQYKCWATQDQEPFNRRVIGLSAYIVNILPWVTPAVYKVTEQSIIDRYK